MMKLSKLAAAPGVVVLGVLGLTGCEFNDTMEGACFITPDGSEGEVGVVSVTAELPLDVEAGSTFTATITEIGVAPGSPEDPPPAAFATLLVLGTEPSFIEIGSVESPATWPHEVDLTVTGQPGDRVVFGVTHAGQFLGTPPDDQVFSCATGGDDSHGVLAFINVVEPQT